MKKISLGRKDVIMRLAKIMKNMGFNIQGRTNKIKISSCLKFKLYIYWAFLNNVKSYNFISRLSIIVKYARKIKYQFIQELKFWLMQFHLKNI